MAFYFVNAGQRYTGTADDDQFLIYDGIVSASLDGGPGTDTLTLRPISVIPGVSIALLSAQITNIERIVVNSYVGDTMVVLRDSSVILPASTTLVGGDGRDIFYTSVSKTSASFTMPVFKLENWGPALGLGHLPNLLGAPRDALALDASLHTNSVTLNARNNYASQQILMGGQGNDILNGSNGDDVLIGGDGSDLMRGGDGNDYIVASLSNDRIDGGKGLDTVSYENAAEAVIIDLFTGRGQNFEGTQSDIIYNVENAVGSFFSDRITGNTLANILQGGDGDDMLAGGVGDDVLDGGTGNDSLSGGSGSDILMGGDGNDILMGYAGADVLTGGAGADSFRFYALSDSAPDAPDIITDYNRREGDIIDLSRIDANSLAAGRQAFHLGGSVFTHVPGELIRVPTGMDMVLQGDVNGDGIADIAILLKDFAVVDFIL